MGDWNSSIAMSISLIIIGGRVLIHQFDDWARKLTNRKLNFFLTKFVAIKLVFVCFEIFVHIGRKWQVIHKNYQFFFWFCKELFLLGKYFLQIILWEFKEKCWQYSIEYLNLWLYSVSYKQYTITVSDLRNYETFKTTKTFDIRLMKNVWNNRHW